MNKGSCGQLICLLLISTALACAPSVQGQKPKPAPQVLDGRTTPVRLEVGTINRDTTWQGTIKIKGVITVAKGAALTISPGTRVAFAWLDADGDGIGDSGLLVKGRLLAEGTGSQPISFTSTARHGARAWGEIKLEDAGPSHFRYCYFNFAYWGLHLHFSPVVVEYCRFEYSEGGVRFRSGPISIRHCLIQENRSGIRYLHSNPSIKRNTIRRNYIGIFIREGSKHPVIAKNNIYENKNHNLKLGEVQTIDISCPENFWGGTNTALIEEKIFDYQDSDYLGKVNYQPIADRSWGMVWPQ